MAKIPDERTRNALLKAQKSEITEHFVYAKLAGSMKDYHNKKVLKSISDGELRHYNLWKKYTQKDVKPDMIKLWKYFLISKIFGITFGAKLMENGERKAQAAYEKISRHVPEAKKILKDEEGHKNSLSG